ncbi:Flp pilus assembly protein CpaB [Novosphingobium sp.]|uniref:Flp pilus assembly protein CpaB n=1 Tax=Novosphingobium sp. TaxID=1874826 RepID=UPI0025EB68A9|nr:Flp pilus assembly protein CpaB [Novosphingobium sp.]
MDKKKLMLLMGAMVVAIGTALAARTLFVGAAAPKAEAAQVAPKGPKVLVAQRALPVGTIITADSVSYQQWPKEMIQDAYFIDGESDMNKLLGTVVRYPVTAGQPVTQGALVKPGDRGFLAAALGPGMRAVTIPVSKQTGVAGFIFPGDHVDLVLTQQVKPTDSGDTLKTAETIVRNLRVLATDQSTETETENGKTVVKTASNVTLEVTPKLAEKIAVADNIGKLSLSLRSLADSQADLDRAIAGGNVKVPAGMSKEDEDKFLSQALNRPVDAGATFVTGGDVSRFQRRSMPSQAQAQRATASFQPYSGPSFGGASSGRPAVIRSGPVVRVTRGKVTTEESVGSR